MAAEAVGFMSSRGGANGGGRAAELVTRDFLGGCAAAADDDARDAPARQRGDAVVPGKASLPKHACPPSSTARDLNLFPVAATPCPAASLAVSSPAAATTTTATTYHSVCTIEKVKTALERFERGKHQHSGGQHSGAGAGASPSSSSVTSSSVKRRGGGVEQGDGCDSPSAAGGGGMVAAACPQCFLYVLISRRDPRCPRCECHVPAPPPPPTPAVSKKPRIDLNVGYLGT